MNFEPWQGQANPPASFFTMHPRCVQMVETAKTPAASRKIATDRPGGTNASPATSVSGSATRNFRDATGTTAARGSRSAPAAAKASAVMADHMAARPRKSRQGMGGGSSRERAAPVVSGVVVMRGSTGS